MAVDTDDNVSTPSRIVQGRAYQKPPDPPVWVSAVRRKVNGISEIELSWTHPHPSGLSFMVEKKIQLYDALNRPNRSRWNSISNWTEIGIDQLIDVVEDHSTEVIYRIRTKDSVDQIANEKPEIVVQTLVT